MSASKCYYYGGGVAASDEPCGFDTNFCCPSGDICVTNGLCQDKNNHLNGSLTFFTGKANPGPYNYTGLYSSASCINSGWRGCVSRCLKYGMTKDAYIWSCNADLESSFCCANASLALDNGDCCSGSVFSLGSAVLALNTSLRSTTSSATSPVVITTTGSATTPTSSSSSTQTATSTPSSSGLSTGAKAGIGIGVAAVCILGLGIVFLWRRTSLLKRRLLDQEPVADVAYKDNREQAQEKVTHGEAPQELSTFSHGQPVELPLDDRVHELSGEHYSNPVGLPK